jgi:hypothetical protein
LPAKTSPNPAASITANRWLPEFRAKIAALEQQNTILRQRLEAAEARAAAAEKRAADAESANNVFRESAKGTEQVYLEEKARSSPA